jgi:glyoxylase I family protein
LIAVSFANCGQARAARIATTPAQIAEGGIDDMVSELAAKGVTIVTPVSHAPGGWSAEFKDPEGHVLSMYQSAERPRKR